MNKYNKDSWMKENMQKILSILRGILEENVLIVRTDPVEKLSANFGGN